LGGFIPQSAEVLSKLGGGIVHVKLGQQFQDSLFRATGTNSLACDAVQNGKQHTISMCDVDSKDTIRYVECLLNELGPTVIAILSAGDDAGHDPSYIWVNQVIAAVAPANQRMPNFNGFERFIPVPIEKAAKNL
jgi:hypothetical protein